MAKKTKDQNLLKFIRTGKRLMLKPPKEETPKNIYSRKSKHKRRHDDSSFFCQPQVRHCSPEDILLF